MESVRLEFGAIKDRDGVSAGEWTAILSADGLKDVFYEELYLF